MRRFDSLRSRGELSALRRRGVRLGAATLYGYGDRVGSAPAVAIAVSKAVGGAVVRNRVRRRIRGALESTPCAGGGVRLFLVARPAAAGAPYGRIASDVASVLAQLERKGR
jgi:ribonuclease P protein component